MKILAFDVSVTGCAVAICDGDLFVEKHFDTDRGQAEMLIPMIDELIKQVGWNIKDIERIAATTGPGSFTGVRIGLATARSFGLALNIPVIGISTLEIMSAQVEKDVLVLIDTKRGDYYGCVNDGVPKIWSEEEVSAYSGEAAKDLKPDLKILAKMATESVVINYMPEPIYLRDAEVSQPKNISVFI